MVRVEKQTCKKSLMDMHHRNSKRFLTLVPDTFVPPLLPGGGRRPTQRTGPQRATVPGGQQIVLSVQGGGVGRQPVQGPSMSSEQSGRMQALEQPVGENTSFAQVHLGRQKPKLSPRKVACAATPCLVAGTMPTLRVTPIDSFGR